MIIKPIKFENFDKKKTSYNELERRGFYLLVF